MTTNADHSTTTVDDEGLNLRQRLFVEAYLATGNAAESYRQAGYTAENAITIRTAALAVRTNVNVAAAIARRTQAALQRLGYTSDRVLVEIVRIAFSDIRDVVTVRAGDVVFSDSDDWSDDAAAAVQSVSVSEFKGKITKTLKMHSKLDALEKLAKNLNLYQDHQRAAGEGMADALIAGHLAAIARLAGSQLSTTSIEGTAVPLLPAVATTATDGEAAP